MTALATLAQASNPAIWDHPPDEEEALRQVLFNAILDFIEEDPERLYRELESEDGDPLEWWACEFVDRRAPKSEVASVEPRTADRLQRMAAGYFG